MTVGAPGGPFLIARAACVICPGRGPAGLESFVLAFVSSQSTLHAVMMAAGLAVAGSLFSRLAMTAGLFLFGMQISSMSVTSYYAVGNALEDLPCARMRAFCDFYSWTADPTVPGAIAVGAFFWLLSVAGLYAACHVARYADRSRIWMRAA